MLESLLISLQDSPITMFFSISIMLAQIYLVYLLFNHPLSHVPGPLMRRFSSLPLLQSSFLGYEASSNAQLHAKYGPIVVTGPQNVDINDGDAIFPIYVNKGGFRKADFYRNFNIGGHATIFSSLDSAERALRAKRVQPLFALSKIRESGISGNIIESSVDDLLAVLSHAKAVQSPAVDLLDLCRQLTMDVLSGYLYGQRWSSFENINQNIADKAKNKSSISRYIESVIAVGGLFKFPQWFISYASSLILYLWPLDAETVDSRNKVERYINRTIDTAKNEKLDTFQTRLLDAGISRDETSANMKDVVFAGTDTPATVLSKLLWNLSRNPDLQDALYREVTAQHEGPKALLHATIREGLRTSMANPTPLSRVVPSQGWKYTSGQPQKHHELKTHIEAKTYDLPAGTVVGVQMHSLHLSPSTYSNPATFNPYRWLSPSGELPNTSNSHVPQLDTETMKRMNRDWFAFGGGARQCIGQNLAMETMAIAIQRVVKEKALEGAKVVETQLPIREWFNSQLLGKRGISISFEGAVTQMAEEGP